MSDVFRNGGVSYLELPAPEPRVLADFYGDVFGWTIGGRDEEPSFEDGTGHVIGHFVSRNAVAGEAGIRPYVYVDDVDATLQRATAHGGEVVREPYPEGDLSVATFRDPAGNVVGVWQRVG
jgi:predicted enzyme related to lactoylglutathione lyase